MKTAIVLSDTHGRRRPIARLAPLFAENDFVVHLGDGAADLRAYAKEAPDKFILLHGNCDPFAGMDEYVFEAEGVRVFCCHGHTYGVKSSLERLAARAASLDCTAALYGHTHRAAIEEVGGVTCINPGALSSYTAPSYCYLVLHRGKFTATIVPVPAE